VNADDDVQWRRLDGRLWTATRDGQPLGTIERGRRYTVIGATGEVLGRFEDLQVAMDALLGGASGRSFRGSGRVVVERTLFGVTAAFGLGAVAVIGYAIAAGLF
jgi:hypothetical protein